MTKNGVVYDFKLWLCGSSSVTKAAGFVTGVYPICAF